jgi:hypothetical protein
MKRRLPLPAHLPHRHALHKRGETARVRGGHKPERRCPLLPLILTLSPQTAGGDPRGACGEVRAP